MFIKYCVFFNVMFLSGQHYEDLISSRTPPPGGSSWSPPHGVSVSAGGGRRGSERLLHLDLVSALNLHNTSFSGKLIDEIESILIGKKGKKE